MTLRTAESPSAARARIRAGEHVGPTSGLAPGFAQANLVVLPADYALDFLRFCVRNPKPCPLLEVTDTGSPRPVALAPAADLRTDVPRYRVFRGGELADEPTDVTRYWRDDLVAFLLGCSFTFEWALADAGLPLAHQDQRVNVPMYVTDRRCVGAGPIRGAAGGVDAPVRTDRHAARRRDLHPLSRHARRSGAHRRPRGARHRRSRVPPTSATRSGIAAGEVPVFWACGVTPQAVALEARPSLAIFHAPGHMFITDRPARRLRLARRSCHDRP